MADDPGQPREEPRWVGEPYPQNDEGRDREPDGWTGVGYSRSGYTDGSQTGGVGGWGDPYPSGERRGTGAGQPVDNFGRALSPWWKRALAIIIDSLIVGIPTSLLLSALNLRGNITTTNNHVHITNTAAYFRGSLIQVAILLAYFSFLDGSDRGQTLGKMMLRIATRDASTGGSIGHSRALARRLIYVLLFYLFLIPGIVNALWPLWDRHRQAWHDRAVGSVVVEVP